MGVLIRLKMNCQLNDYCELKRKTKGIMVVEYDGMLDIAIGGSRKAKVWNNKNIKWPDLLEKLSKTHRTAETFQEYMTAEKPRQDDIKDVGGFVGGYLTEGQRKAATVQYRQLLTLDVDYGKLGMWDDFTLCYDNAAVLYTTHKHCPDNPRFRLLFPLDRPVNPDEYEAIGRRVASGLGIDNFDPTTFEPARLMYWPSTSKDGEYVFYYQDGPWLSADEVLSAYKNWQDRTEWPVGSKEREIAVRSAIKKQDDPLTKPGIIGAFCRTYTIQKAIDEYLSNAYEQCDISDRYTYIPGSCSGGMIVYDDKFAYSHHSTDPTSGKLCNAFDLVRLHLFGDDDKECKENTPINKMPSFLAMEALAMKDEAVRLQMGRERVEEAQKDFDGDYPAGQGNQDAEDAAGDLWLTKLDIDKKGNYLSTIDNIVLILENDPRLKDTFAFDEFEQREIILRSLPWRSIGSGQYVKDTDDANLSHYLEKKYGIPLNVIKQQRAFAAVLERHKVHPVRDYLQAQTWDGFHRVDTLFIDYLGATDTPYTRAVTRKILAAAVSRIFSPGVKFDYALVLVGKQGVGKSTIIQRLGGKWYSDTFTTVEGKEAFEQLQGVWIMEMGELAGLRKAEVGTIKHFVSKTVDRYRMAYGRRVSNIPRQCVFFGTTNNAEFLRNDANGNRKFWPVPVYQQSPAKDIFDDLTQEEIGQIWAEAAQLYQRGESLHLSADLEAEANLIQADHTEQDERLGIITEYLDELLPEAWDSWDIDERRAYLTGGDFKEEGTRLRKQICVAEIWCELLGNRFKDMSPYNTKDLHAILRNMPGWMPTKGQRRFKNYGQQKAYTRI